LLGNKILFPKNGALTTIAEKKPKMDWKITKEIV